MFFKFASIYGANNLTVLMVEHLKILQKASQVEITEQYFSKTGIIHP
jgi:hypothetical protein